MDAAEADPPPLLNSEDVHKKELWKGASMLPRFLVWLPRFGLGNTLRGYCSAFVFAFLSGRRLVRWHGGAHKHVSTQTRPLTSLTLDLAVFLIDYWSLCGDTVLHFCLPFGCGPLSPRSSTSGGCHGVREALEWVSLLAVACWCHAFPAGIGSACSSFECGGASLVDLKGNIKSVSEEVSIKCEVLNVSFCSPKWCHASPCRCWISYAPRSSAAERHWWT